MIMHFMYLINEKILKFAFWKSLTLGCTDVQCTLTLQWICTDYALFAFILSKNFLLFFFFIFFYAQHCPLHLSMLHVCVYDNNLSIWRYLPFLSIFVFRLSLRDDTEKRSLIFRTCFAGCPRLSTPWDQLSLRARKYNLSMNNLTRWRYAMLKIRLRLKKKYWANWEQLTCHSDYLYKKATHLYRTIVV